MAATFVIAQVQIGNDCRGRRHMNRQALCGQKPIAVNDHGIIQFGSPSTPPGENNGPASGNRCRGHGVRRQRPWRPRRRTPGAFPAALAEEERNPHRPEPPDRKVAGWPNRVRPRAAPCPKDVPATPSPSRPPPPTTPSQPPFLPRPAPLPPPIYQ